MRPGDVLLGLASSGPHSNGYSLIRKVLEVSAAELNQPLGETSLGQALLAPTRIYVKSLLALGAELEIHGLAHITGGGLTDNVPRVLPRRHHAHVKVGSWEIPELFGALAQHGGVATEEMFRVFNMGIGMVLVVPAHHEREVLAHLKSVREPAYRIGEIVQGSRKVIYRE